MIVHLTFRLSVAGSIFSLQSLTAKLQFLEGLIRNLLLFTLTELANEPAPVTHVSEGQSWRIHTGRARAEGFEILQVLVNWGVTVASKELTELCAAAGRAEGAAGSSCRGVPRDHLPSHSLGALWHPSASCFQLFHCKNEKCFLLVNSCNGYVDNTRKGRKWLNLGCSFTISE